MTFMKKGCNMRNWTVLLIGGASGTGKSSLAYGLANFYSVNVLEMDDITEAVKAMTPKDYLPTIYSEDFFGAGVDGNVKWLIDVSKELFPALKAVIDRHIEDELPVIIDGDFIHPELIMTFKNPNIKTLFVYESKEQIVKNYQLREGGDPQHYRADISSEYGKWIFDTCVRLGIGLIEARPWDTVVDRVVEHLQ